MFTAEELLPVKLTLELALITTVLLLVATPLAWWLHTKIKVEGTDQLNCYFALGSSAKRAWFLSLSRHGTFRSLGRLDRGLRHRFADIYISGFVIGSIVYSMPFAVQPLQAAFRIDRKAPFGSCCHGRR